jgi:hypothetical protein
MGREKPCRRVRIRKEGSRRGIRSKDRKKGGIGMGHRLRWIGKMGRKKGSVGESGIDKQGWI